MLDAMGLIQIYSTTKSNSQQLTPAWRDENQSFCNCGANEEKNCRVRHASKPYVAMGVCECGEDVCKTFNWNWDRKLIQPQTIVSGHNISFHPCYSQGTSVIRGDKELEKGMIHYWEIKIVSWFSGTDLMVGIGTDLVDLLEHRYKFSSVLGLDNQSWGFSHRGMIQHKNVLKYYGKPFTKQCIVGIYLDLFKGHLEFYVNRIPQGIAYKNIPLSKNSPVYPMVCSTSAKSSIRLINASSYRECLQFRCFKVISRYPQLLDKVQQMPGLSNLCKELWYLLPQNRYQYSNNEKNKNSGCKLNIENDNNIATDDTEDSVEFIDDSTIDDNTIDDSTIDDTLYMINYEKNKLSYTDESD